MITCFFKNYFSSSFRHIVVDGLVVKANKILLVKRAGPWLESGKWALPGGYLNRGENGAEAVVREVLEETGYQVKVIKFLSIIDDPHRFKDVNQNIGFIYLIKPIKKISTFDDEISKVKWFDINHLPQPKTMAFDHLQIIKKQLSLC